MSLRLFLFVIFLGGFFAACAPMPSQQPLVHPHTYPYASSEAEQRVEVTQPLPLASLNRLPLASPDPQQRPHMVVSPYHPYNLIDVADYKSGDVVGDPSTASTDLATGKVRLETSKLFRIP